MAWWDRYGFFGNFVWVSGIIVLFTGWGSSCCWFGWVVGVRKKFSFSFEWDRWSGEWLLMGRFPLLLEFFLGGLLNRVAGGPLRISVIIG